ncbi:MAG: GAF domain-containing protein [Acidobacteria bacterium]|nr:GAF domain-containing protein [Acidobacteriota bacterium]
MIARPEISSLLRCQIEIDSEGQSFTGLIWNISRAGMVLAIPVEDELQITPLQNLTVTYHCSFAANQICLNAVVRWIYSPDVPHYHLAGIQFLNHESQESNLEPLLVCYPPKVLVVSENLDTVAWIRNLLKDQYFPITIQTLQEAGEILQNNEVTLVIVDQASLEHSNSGIAHWNGANSPVNREVKLLLVDDSTSEGMAEAKLGKIFYTLRNTGAPDTFLTIVASAVKFYWKTVLSDFQLELDLVRRAVKMQNIAPHVQRLMRQTRAEDLCQVATQAIEELLEANRAACWMYQAVERKLSAPGQREGDAQNWDSSIGLIGYVAGTGLAIHLTQDVRSDARYYPKLDDPQGKGTESFLAEPVKDAQGEVLAVLVAIRDENRPAFTDDQFQILNLLASQLAPMCTQLMLQNRFEAFSARRRSNATSPSEEIFRKQALEAHAAGMKDTGSLLRLSPAWVGWVYWLLVTVFLTGVGYLSVGRINEYATGPAIVRVNNRTDLTALSAGMVKSIQVQPGQKVEAHQVLVRFYDDQEAAALEQVQKTYQVQLAKSLSEPNNPALQQELTALRAQKESIESQLEARLVKAPRSGVIRDIRVRPNQHLSPGESLLTLSDEKPGLSVIAILPGHFRPLLKTGTSLRLEPSGYKYAYQYLTIESISDEVIGPNEMKRYLGQEIADTLEMKGPVILVRGQIPSATFTTDGKIYDYYDGMQGVVEVPVRTERIIFTLAPWLKNLFDNSHE